MIRFFNRRLLIALAALAVVGAACGGTAATVTPTQPTATPTQPASTPTQPTATPTPPSAENRPPTADFTWDPAEVPTGDNFQTVVTFTASASDPDGDALAYAWQFTGGKPITASGQTATTTFPGVAPYRVTLTVSDGRGGEAPVAHTVPLGAASPTPTPASVPIATPAPGGDEASAKYRWEFFDVGEGAKPAIALSSAGEPGIAFMLEEPEHGFVKYAAWNGGGFDVSDVDDGYFYGPLDLDIGPDDRPHISWHDHQDPNNIGPSKGDVVHAGLTDDGWQVDAVFSPGHDGWDSSIVVDSLGNVHMAAVDPAQFGSDSGIEYYFFDGNEWEVEEVGSGPIDYEWGTSIAVDSEGQPRITYFDTDSQDLMYAEKTDNGWRKTAVEFKGDVGRFSSIVLDSLGLARISYLELTGAESGASSGTIWFAKDTDAPEGWPTWETEEIGRVEDLFTGFLGARKITSIVLDRDGNPLVVYADQSTISLAYHDGKEWHTDIVATSDSVPFGQLTSLAIDSDGTLHLTYTEIEKRESPGIVGTVKYARGTLNN